MWTVQGDKHLAVQSSHRLGLVKKAPIAVSSPSAYAASRFWQLFKVSFIQTAPESTTAAKSKTLNNKAALPSNHNPHTHMQINNV